MKNFFKNRQYIENEFENAHFDSSTGLGADVLREKLCEIQQEITDEPRQIVCAKAYSYLLDNVQLEINENTPFSVKINIGVDYSYFASADVFAQALFYPQREEKLMELFPEEYKRMKEGESVGLGNVFTDFWHTVPDWENLLEKGFAGILKSAEETKKKLISSGNCNGKQITFLDSVIICYKAILRLMERIYTYSLSFNVPIFSECVKKLISNPPETLYEVMQFSILYLYVEEIGCERGRTLGPVDRLYYPYFKKDIENGKSIEDIEELFSYFFIHFTATKRFAQQPFTMCGGSVDGTDFSNDLSELILDTYDSLNIYDPKIHIRYHKNINEKILTKALSMIRKGNSSICIINDKAVFSGYERIGIPACDAENYVLLGCYEPVIMGKEEAEVAVCWLNTAKCIEFALNGGKDLQTGKQIGYESKSDFESFESFYDTFINQLDYCLNFVIDFAQRQGEYSTLINPSPIYSSSFADCIEKGMDVHEYPLKYNNMSLKCFALATVVDSLVAIKKYVFEKKVLSLADLKNALISDWKGYENLQCEIANDREKYGNNLSVPDEIMSEITTHLAENYCGKKLYRGGKLRLGLDSIDYCVYFGRTTFATPDGRRAGMPLSKNLCTSEGKDRGGITAYMQSVLKIDTSAFLDSAILDFFMHPSAIEGDKGLSDFASLVKVFFEYGGFAIQGNIVNSETLKEAQNNPEKYSTLQVRVCGWNEYFVNLTKEKQDMLIRQCEVEC